MVIDSWYVVDVAIIVRWLWYCFSTLGGDIYTGAHSSRALQQIFHRGGDYIITWATFSWRGRFYTGLNIPPRQYQLVSPSWPKRVAQSSNICRPVGCRPVCLSPRMTVHRPNSGRLEVYVKWTNIIMWLLLIANAFERYNHALTNFWCVCFVHT